MLGDRCRLSLDAACGLVLGGGCGTSDASRLGMLGSQGPLGIDIISDFNRLLLAVACELVFGDICRLSLGGACKGILGISSLFERGDVGGLLLGDD